MLGRRIMNLFGELKRRNVFKVGIVYIFASWIIAQVVSILNAPLRLPDWFSTVVIVLLGLGFPIALILAWAFELTPAGLERVPDLDVLDPKPKRKRKKAGDGNTRIPVRPVGEDGAQTADETPALVLRDFSWVRSAALPKAVSPTIGREHELAALRDNLAQARQGAGRIVAMTGEPGIGKTQLLRAFSEEAAAQGAAVLTGLCYEEEGSPSYFPWLQILQAAAEMTEQADLLSMLAAETEALSVAESSAAPTNVQSGPNAVRNVMYHTAVNRLVQSMAGRFVVILFDNLHWADAPSLKLLEFLGRVLADHPILVIATYQDIEITRNHPLFGTMATLRREAKVERIRLDGLTRDAVATIVEQWLDLPVTAKLVDEIYRHTDGNPFFVTEVVRGIADELRMANADRVEIQVPDGIHETIGRRLDRLSPACNTLLAQASVIGRIFETRQLEKLSESPGIEILSLLEEAMAAAIVEETDRLGHFQFTHALITETLYDELPLSRRVAIHRSIARVLEEIHSDNIEPFLGQIAHHYHHAARSGGVQKAIDTALAAARYAERIVAYEDAIEYYELALEMLALDPSDRRTEVADTKLAMVNLGAKIGINWVAHGKQLEDVIQLARDCGNRKCLVEASCQYVFATLPAPSQKMLDYLDDALGQIEPDDLVNRARLLARQAAALDMLGEHRKADSAVQQAIEVAKASGDAMSECDTFGWACIVLRSRPETLSERLRLAEESVRLASSASAAPSGSGAAGAEMAANEARRWLLLNCQEAGRMARVKELIAELERSADRRPFFRMFAEGAKAFCALVEGHWSEAQQLIANTYEVGRVTDAEGAEGVFGAQMFHLFRELGRLRELVPVLRKLSSDGDRPVWPAGLAILNVEVGDLDGARRIFDEVFAAGIEIMPRDALYLTSLTHLAETCVALGDRDRAGNLHRALLPYSGQMSTHPTAVCLGPVDRLLGMLARLLQHHEKAADYFTKALALCESAQTKPWKAHTKFDFARLHCDVGENGEAERLVREASAIASSLGMAGLLAKIDGATELRPAM